MGALRRRSFTEASLLCFGSESYQGRERGASASKAGTPQRLAQFSHIHSYVDATECIDSGCFHFPDWHSEGEQGLLSFLETLRFVRRERESLCRKLLDCFSETLVDVFIDKSTQNREGNWKPRVRLSSLGSRLCSGVGDKTWKPESWLPFSLFPALRGPGWSPVVY